jgi:hypothetical protein
VEKVVRILQLVRIYIKFYTFFKDAWLGMGLVVVGVAICVSG